MVDMHSCILEIQHFTTPHMQTHTQIYSETVLAALDCRTWLMSCLAEPWSCSLWRYNSCTTCTYLITFYKIVWVARKSHYCKSEPYTENTKWPYTRALYVCFCPYPTHLHTVFFSSTLLFSVSHSSALSPLLTHALTHTPPLSEKQTHKQMGYATWRFFLYMRWVLKVSWWGTDASGESLLTGH